jgi:hypothetical protein
VASEATFLLRCKEIGHNFRIDTLSYPGTSKRLEALLLTGYLFSSVKKYDDQEVITCRDLRTQHELSPRVGRGHEPGINLSLTHRLAFDILKEYIMKEVGTIQDNLTKQEDPTERRIKTVVKLVNYLKPKPRFQITDQPFPHAFRDMAFKSSLAHCLNADDMYFLKSVVKNTSFDSDTGCFASAAEGINALLFD